MDTSAPDITFDDFGICNYCTDFLDRFSHILNEEPSAKRARLETLIAKIKDSGKGKPYDCVVGVSGGVDSSWILVKAVELGLRPLPVHMDNGWNSELAQNNIANLVKGLGLDLYTHVIEWREYRGLMQAFFDADVVDVELLYDNAMQAVNFKQASRFGIRHILSGCNTSTEGMMMPRTWHAFKFDKKNILQINKKFTNAKITTFPSIGTWDRVYFELIKKIQWVSPLNFMDYKKEHAIQELKLNFNFKPYLYKHYESVFTRLYQGFLLPKKFGIDKRKVHLSSLIISGQISRESAILEIQKPPYMETRFLEDDTVFFLKKMGWSQQQLQDYLQRPRKEHSAYGSEETLYTIMANLYRKTFNITSE